MSRKRIGKKKKTSIALDEELLKWVDEMIKRKRFANRTHAIEYCLQHVKEEWEKAGTIKVKAKR
jgi:Arc/MetJ-type ribon-helix-helix transcriptional regulator